MAAKDVAQDHSYKVPAQYAAKQPSEDTISAALQSTDPTASIRLLLDNDGLDPNLPIGYGSSLLVRAVAMRDSKLVNLLLDRDADANFRSSVSSTIRSMCGVEEEAESERQRREIIKLLLQHGADADAHDGLWLAAKWLDLEAARLMLENGNAEKSLHRLENEVLAKQADVEFGLGTPLHEAAAADAYGRQDESIQLKILQLFMRHGAVIKAKDARGRTAEEVAHEAGNDLATNALMDL